MNDWICQIRPGNPYNYGLLHPKDFFRPREVLGYLVFEEGIQVACYNPTSRTIIVKNKEFCVVVKKVFRSYNVLGVCLPKNVNGREVVFYSPTVNPLTKG